MLYIDNDNTIHVDSAASLDRLHALYHTTQTIMRDYGYQRAAAYRIMQRLPWQYAIITIPGTPPRRIRVADRGLVKQHILDNPPGNPNWHDSATQAELASRRCR